MKRAARVLFILSLSVAQYACVVQIPAEPNDPAFAPVHPLPTVMPLASSGAIYNVANSNSLYSDRKARRVGDLITVVLNEQTSSSKSSNVTVDKGSAVTIGENAAGNTLLGTNPSLKALSLATNISGDREFTGEADADQSNSLSGNISVTVAGILPNGNLQVRGEKWLTLNQGDEFIRISGIVRPEDVGPENTVMSFKLANARITYSGRGSLADSAQMGWLGRVFNSPVWPF